MLIECRLGPATTTVGSSNYEFSRDDHGRYVATVTNPDHIKCLLSAGTYAEAQLLDDDGDADDEQAVTDGDDIAVRPRRGRRKRAG